jgi:hypothetical protein
MLKIADFDRGYETPVIPAAKTPTPLTVKGSQPVGCTAQGSPSHAASVISMVAVLS